MDVSFDTSIFASLSPEAMDALSKVTAQDYPDEYNPPSSRQICWLYLVLVGERPACEFSYRRKTGNTAGFQDDPLNSVLSEIPLHYSIIREAYYGRSRFPQAGDDTDEFEYRMVFVSDDGDFLYRVSHSLGDHDEIGLGFGYPEEAVTSFSNDNTMSMANGAFEEAQDKYGLTREDISHLFLVPYAPPDTKSGVEAAIAEGKRYKRVCHDIARLYPELSELSDRAVEACTRV